VETGGSESLRTGIEPTSGVEPTSSFDIEIEAENGSSSFCEKVKMRGTNLRSSPRPANSMEQDSFDSYDDMEDMLVMSANSLNLSPSSTTSAPSPRTPSSSAAAAAASASTSGRSRGGGLCVEEEDELAKSVIVTNVDLRVFDDLVTKTNFEIMFREYEPTACFHYLRSFRRIRVDFESHLTAAMAKQKLDSTLIGDNVIHCYFIQVLSPCTDEDAYLHVPPLEKQFLISPPCSPPVGWEQPREDKPVVDYDLLAAMAQLSPGENHELHPSKEVTLLGKSISTPSIVVHVCEEQAANNAIFAAAKAGTKRIKQTPRPDRQSSLD